MNLLMSLGHNSSVVGTTDEGDIIAGYEEERFTRIKSEPSFPSNSLYTIMHEYGWNNVKKEPLSIFISHWYDNFDFYKTPGVIKQSRWNPDIFEALSKDGFLIKLLSLNETFTHHDAHAYSVYDFYKWHGGDPDKKLKIIVADGFGNLQEVFSIYSVKNGEIKNIKKCYGYQSSMGLFYQYATSFCGMKENEDEYKFLGYESEITKVLNDLHKTHQFIAWAENHFIQNYNSPSSPSKSEYIILEDLTTTKELFHELFTTALKSCNINPEDKSKVRTLIGYIIQNTIERVLSTFVEEGDNLLVAGGLFYNVKLNRVLANKCNSFCVIPLAGDQGAPIGLFTKKKNKSIKWGDLCWGKRYLRRFIPNPEEGLYYIDDKRELIKLVLEKLRNDEIVNVVTGNMEFGPRALCNTSTLALPTVENVNIINTLNGRNTIMPMAPVCRQEGLEYLFEDQYNKTVGSDNYMILTYDYKSQIVEKEFDKYRGVMHNYPTGPKYSGRPQVIRNTNHYVYKVLEEIEKYGIKALINTSFNIHGVPIVHSTDNALVDFRYQQNNNKSEFNKKVSLILSP